MGNCLVTKLKAVVDNDNLLKLGEIRILNHPSLYQYPGEMIISTNANGPVVIKVEGNGTVSYDGQTGVEVSVPSGVDTAYIYFSQGTEDYTISINNKYGLKELRLDNVFGEFYLDQISGCDLERLKGNAATPDGHNFIIGDIDILKALKNLKSVSLFNDGVYGDISALADLTTLTGVYMNSIQNLTGNITSLAKLTNLGAFDFHGTQVTGSIESFVQAQIANGRSTVGTASPILITNGLSQFTFGGTLHNAPWTQFLVWDSASKITIYGSNDGTPTIENSTVVYAKGATAEEIAAWEQAGKTVVIVS